MKTIQFKGYSDDTFGWYPVEKPNTGEDHDDCAQFTVRTFIVQHEKERVAVTGVYGQECMWSVGIAPVEDDDEMPGWPMLWTFEGYTAVLTIHLPDNATIELVQPKYEDE